MSKLILYPASWIFNAGVVGMLKVVDEFAEKVGMKARDVYRFTDDCGVEVDMEKYADFIDKIVKKNNYKYAVVFGTTIVANQGEIKNFLGASTHKSDWDIYVRFLKRSFERDATHCFLCNSPYKMDTKELSDKEEKLYKKWLHPHAKSYKYTSRSSHLLSSAFPENFPNQFWNYDPATVGHVCDFCSIVALLHFYRGLEDVGGGFWAFLDVSQDFETLYVKNVNLPKLFETEKKTKRDLRQGLLKYLIEGPGEESEMQKTFGAATLYLLPRTSSNLSGLRTVILSEDVVNFARENSKLIELIDKNVPPKPAKGKNQSPFAFNYLSAVDWVLDYLYAPSAALPSIIYALKKAVLFLNSKQSEHKFRATNINRFYVRPFLELISYSPKFGDKMKEVEDKKNLTVKMMSGLGFHTNEKVKEALKKVSYQLIEAIKNGNKGKAYYLLLRPYVVYNEPFPLPLTKAFEEDEETFKILMLAFVSGLFGNESSSSAKGGDEE